MTARELPVDQRRRAIVLGGIGAVVLRIAAAVAVTLLLAVPFLQAAAALVLLFIAYRLVRPKASHVDPKVRAAGTLRSAIVTILLADAVMSLENILGVGAAAHGSIVLLAFGLALSIPIVLFGSSVVVGLLDRYPRAIWIGALALIWTAVELMLDEPAIAMRDRIPWSAELVLTAIFLAAVLALRAAASRLHPPLA
jgi:YjbE family integral membrane protein